jgi:hypothetical protein
MYIGNYIPYFILYLGLLVWWIRKNWPFLLIRIYYVLTISAIRTCLRLKLTKHCQKINNTVTYQRGYLFKYIKKTFLSSPLILIFFLQILADLPVWLPLLFFCNISGKVWSFFWQKTRAYGWGCHYHEPPPPPPPPPIRDFLSKWFGKSYTELIHLLYFYSRHCVYTLGLV